jgi:hypothetical protein
MRTGFVHEGLVELDPGADPAAVGAAVTVALCGHWEHEPPCPLAPHNTSAEPLDHRLSVRVRFACEASDEAAVRDLIQSALRGEFLDGPQGRSIWHWVSSGPSEVLPTDEDLLGRLVHN